MAYVDEVLADSPFAYWRLGEAAGTIAEDASPNNRDGTYVNTPTLAAVGALVADADTAVTFASASSESMSSSVLTGFATNLGTSSVEFWIKTTTTSLQAILGSLNTGSTTMLQVLLNSDSAGVLAVGSTAITYRDNSGKAVTLAITHDIYDGEWHHVVFVFTNPATNIITAYVDGQARAGVTATGGGGAPTTYSNFANQMPVAARNNRGAVDLFFNGSLDEVAIYTARLSAARVAAHYTAAGYTVGDDGPGVFGVIPAGNGPPLVCPYHAESALLSWQPPGYPDYISYEEVHVTNANRALVLTGGVDYYLIFDEELEAGPLSIQGGRNVVCLASVIDMSARPTGRTASDMIGLYLNNVRGEVYFENYHFLGAPHTGVGNSVAVAGALGDGIQINSPSYGATPGRRVQVTLQNGRIENVRADCKDQQDGIGAYAANEVHPDIIHIFGETTDFALRIDKLSVRGVYMQGYFMQSGGHAHTMDWRRIDVDASDGTYDGVTSAATTPGPYASSLNTTPGRAVCQDCYLIKPASKTFAQCFSPAASQPNWGGWTGWTEGAPPGGEYVALASLGLTGYTSPGYQAVP